MSFKWHDYLYLASNLLTPPKTAGDLTEASLRSAISRAYYAAFNLAQFHLVEIENRRDIPTSGEAHIYVREAFEKSSDDERKEIGVALGRLHRKRKKADYRETFKEIEAASKTSIRDAHFIITTLRKL